MNTKSITRKWNAIKSDPILSLIIILNKIAIIFPTKLYLRLLYRLRVGKTLNLRNPKTYNEKLQWLKIHYRKPEFTAMVDKIEAKKYVAALIGEEYIIPTIAEYDSVEDINWEVLPNQFVMKCTHDSGGIVICKDKLKLDKKKAIKKLKKGLKKSYYYQNREWPYKNVRPRIICEEYKVDESGYELKDYKLFCFDGVVKALFIATDRGKQEVETKFDFYDADFNHLPITNGHPNSNKILKKPIGFEKMKELAGILSKGLPHLRVDFYDINGNIYFGELTFFHWSGMIPFEPEEWDYKFGSWIKLPNKEV